MDKQTWNRLYNEGGEGYNPYDAKRAVVLSASSRLYDRLDAINRQLGWDTVTGSRYDALQAEKLEILAQIKALTS